MTNTLKDLLKFSRATAVLVLGSFSAAVSHWYARSEGEMYFTILGFLIATFSGMYYGLQVPDLRNEAKLKKLENQISSE